MAALAIDDAIHLALLAQVCTTMGTEALKGTRGSYAAFIHAVTRPHLCQVRSAICFFVFSNSDAQSTSGEMRHHENKFFIYDIPCSIDVSPLSYIAGALGAFFQPFSQFKVNPQVSWQPVHSGLPWPCQGFQSSPNITFWQSIKKSFDRTHRIDPK